MNDSRWYFCCKAFADVIGLDETTFHILDAFGPSSHPHVFKPASESVETLAPLLKTASSFDELENGLSELAGHLKQTIVEVLSSEVDSDQASMFARRFDSVFRMLTDISIDSDVARLYRVGFVCRLAEILCGPIPRVLRVRAICDYYYSQGAIVFHRLRQSGHEIPTLEELLEKASWKSLGGTIEYASILGDTTKGPVSIHLLKAKEVRLEARDSRVPSNTTFPTWAHSEGSTAGVSGGFFLYSEIDIAAPSRRTDPVGLLVHKGQVFNPPVFRRSAVLQNEAGDIALERVGMRGVSILWRGDGIIVEEENQLDLLGQTPVAFNRAFAKRLPPHSFPSFSAVGSHVCEVGAGVQSIPLAGYVLVLPICESTELPEPCDSLSYKLPYYNGSRVMEAMAGGPRLLDESPDEPATTEDIQTPDLRSENFDGTAPPVTFSQDETFDQNLLPRMVVGLTRKQELVFAAIDGRNFQQAPGMTLRDAAHLMRALDCYRVINLDGGSSKRMVMNGQSVDLSTTEVVRPDSQQTTTHIRPVHSSILLYSND